MQVAYVRIDLQKNILNVRELILKKGFQCYYYHDMLQIIIVKYSRRNFMLSLDELLDETWKIKRITSELSRSRNKDLDISIVQFMMLHEMIYFDTPLIMKNFCSKYSINKSFASIQLTELLKKKMISAVTSNEDRRVHFFEPTLTGEKTYRDMVPFVESEIKNIKRGIKKSLASVN